ncbi:PBSX family phage terminase large subunit [Mycetocola reblochoni]|uniref:Phage terminase, large subunit n=2 Tax=Mycetocola reblochoni TaxID=331618 RepID=A0A1R4JQ10_9MICO|nr:PBSX family phage terminase large subunit [Mycetocola reblochoni]RLP68364.1 PBSX family phage terminase large subunit [Mycetocola reblochoni]SJN34062.1 Phage terminase, large subunit [Mycetocola reblochoni REB411]
MGRDAFGQVTDVMSLSQMRSIVHCRDKKVALWSGAVSSGKTFSSLWAFLMAVPRAPRGGNIVIVGRTLDTVYANVFKLLTDPAIFGDLAKHVSYTQGAKTATILGREVLVYGANDGTSETKIRGSTIGLAYVDELTILPEGFWDMLYTRLRVPGARVMATTNPGSQNHWLRKKWILKAEQKGLIHFHFTMDDNPSLEPEYVAEQKAAFAGVFYDRFIRGLWTNAEGAVYSMWDAEKHVVPWGDLPPIERVLSVGTDYGTTNTTAAVMLGLTAEEIPRLVLLDEWSYSSRDNHGRTVSDDYLARNIIDWLPQRHHPEGNPLPEYVFLDPSAASLRTRMRELGTTTWAADNDVSAGIGDVGALLDRGRLIVSDRCAGVLEEITEFQWDPKAAEKGVDAVIKRDDHFMDALRYAVRSSRNLWAPYINYTDKEAA